MLFGLAISIGPGFDGVKEKVDIDRVRRLRRLRLFCRVATIELVIQFP